MRLQSVLCALPLLAFAAPVSAQDVVFISGTGDEVTAAASYDATDSDTDIDDTNSEPDTMGIAGQISDPAVQDGIASAVEIMTSTMMRLPVGQFAEAIENARPGTVGRRISRDATVADLVGRDAQYLPEKLGTRSRKAMGMVSDLARAMAVMMPEFERMGRDMEDSFKAAKTEARRNRN